MPLLRCVSCGESKNVEGESTHDANYLCSNCQLFTDDHSTATTCVRCRKKTQGQQFCEDCLASIAKRNGFAPIAKRKRGYSLDGDFTGHAPYLLAIIFLIPVIDTIIFKSLPYEYFMLLRVLGTGGLAYFAYKDFSQSTELLGVKFSYIFAGLAILYNPFLPVELTRTLWAPINFFTGLVICFYGLLVDDDVLEASKAPPLAQFTPDESIPTKSITNIEEHTKREPVEDDKVQVALSLIIDPLKLQRDFILNDRGGQSYMKSNVAVGFIGGFTDGFLQKSAAKLALTSIEETSVVAAVQGIIFENFDITSNNFFEVQSEDDEVFLNAQVQGGHCAFKLFNDPKDKSAQMGWYLHFEDWCNQKLNS